MGFGGWCMTNKDFNHVLDTESKPRWYTVRYEPTAPGIGVFKDWRKVRHCVMTRYGLMGSSSKPLESKARAFKLDENVSDENFTVALQKAYSKGKEWIHTLKVRP